MQSTNDWKEWKRFFSTKEDAIGHIRGGKTMNARNIPGFIGKYITGGTVLAILVLLFLASAIYLVFQGGFDAMSSPRAESSMAAVAARPADAGGAPRSDKASSGTAAPPDYFPAGYINRGRDGDGNVMTYEHD